MQHESASITFVVGKKKFGMRFYKLHPENDRVYGDYDNAHVIFKKVDKCEYMREMHFLRMVPCGFSTKVLGGVCNAKIGGIILFEKHWGDLVDLRNSTLFRPQHVPLVIGQLCVCVQYLHSIGVVHNDIKPENICLRHDLETIVLIDYQLAVERGDVQSINKFTGSMSYAAPEKYQKVVSWDKGDVWSVGMTGVAFDNALPWTCAVQTDPRYAKFVKGELCIQTSDPHAGIVARACLVIDYKARPTMNDVLSCLRECMPSRPSRGKTGFQSQFQEQTVTPGSVH